MSEQAAKLIRNYFSQLTHEETLSIFRDLFLPELTQFELVKELTDHLDDADREDLSIRLSTNPME